MPAETPSYILAAACDLNGQMRGKRLPGSQMAKLDSGLRMPLSALNVDIWGADIEGSPLVFETGDTDGHLSLTDRGLIAIPWSNPGGALAMMRMSWEDGRPYMGDPMQVLRSEIQRYADMGLYPTVGIELEFTLFDDTGPDLRPPKNPNNGRAMDGADILSVQTIDALGLFLDGLQSGAEAMGIAVETLTKESGVGQFEVTLAPAPAQRAAENAWLFKPLTRAVARKHGMAATFMAKPVAEEPGNGMHMHVSIADRGGQNIFAEDTPDATPRLHAAIAGCLTHIPASTLIFAPHGNSYARLTPGNHAPTGASWGHENRTVALRVPGGSPASRRIEHRVPGGDTNPFLVLSVILAAMRDGMDRKLTPPPETTGNAYDLAVPGLEPDWAAAITRFEQDEDLARVLPRQLIDNFTATKRQELRLMRARDSQPVWPILLERV